MGSFNKRYIITEAENVLNKCNEQLNKSEENVKLFALKNKNKKLKRNNIIWKVCTVALSVLLVIAIIL